MIDIRKYLRGDKGFTLVEMMVVLIIIAVLIAGGIRFYIGYIGRAKITKATGDITTMQAALDSYYAQHSTYPATNITSLEDAGLSTFMVSTSATSPVPYVYATSGTAGYKIWTAVKVSGDNYVAGSGVDGKSDPPITTLSSL